MRDWRSRIDELRPIIDRNGAQLAIFGSVLDNINEYPNDIDLLIFTDENNVGVIKDQIDQLRHIGPLYVEKIICKYEWKPKKSKKPKTRRTGRHQTIPLHIAFLPEEVKVYESTRLWSKNKHRLLFL